MNIVDDPVETIHVYMVREKEQRAPLFLPLFAALVCLAVIVSVTVYSGAHPSYTHETLRIPARVLPLQTFKTAQPVIPTGIKTYPATYAHGFLTFSNGSIIGQSIPEGFTIDGAATDSAVYVPPASADGFGTSTVSAHLLTSGINKSTLSINEVIGASLFVRNLSPFTGGHPSYSVHFITEQDRVEALTKARAIVAAQVLGLHYPCSETVSGAVVVTWRCQFITYKVPSYMQVTRVVIQGRNLLVDVVFVVRPRRIWVR